MKKDAGIAAVLNTIIPGLGWIYIESLILGIGSIILNSILLYLTIFNNIFFIIAWLCLWIASIIIVYNTVKENENPIKKQKKQKLVTCKQCKKNFYIFGNDNAECPHCGHLYKNHK